MLLTDYHEHEEPEDGRGCGERKEDGTYWFNAIGTEGIPLWMLLKDPPVVMDWTAMGISPQGLSIIQDPETGINHAYDWVGAKHYPYWPDHYEEGRRYGFSGYIPVNFDWSKMTPGQSERRLIHPKGSLANIAELWEHRMWDTCKTRQDAHTKQVEIPDWFCITFLWELLTSTGKEVIESGPLEPRRCVRARPSFTYFGLSIPDRFVPDWQPAWVISLPLTVIEVVRGTEHEARAERIEHLNPALPIAFVNE